MSSRNPAIQLASRFIAAGLAVAMAMLGWFLRSESAHDHLHVGSSAVAFVRSGKPIGLAGLKSLAVSTKAPRWLKVAPVPPGLPKPAEPHRHRSYAFDSLASGGWGGLFAPVELPVPNWVVLAVTPRTLAAQPHGPEWLLAPGRAPPACA